MIIIITTITRIFEYKSIIRILLVLFEYFRSFDMIVTMHTDSLKNKHSKHESVRL